MKLYKLLFNLFFSYFNSFHCGNLIKKNNLFDQFYAIF